MGTLIMISGANGSGKSRYAERIVARTAGERYYIATMRPCSEENLQRIEKHREQRKDLQFTTLECPYQVGAAAVERDGVVLLEDVSNLLANAMFERGGDEASVYADIEALCSRCRRTARCPFRSLIGTKKICATRSAFSPRWVFSAARRSGCGLYLRRRRA